MEHAIGGDSYRINTYLHILAIEYTNKHRIA